MSIPKWGATFLYLRSSCEKA